MHKREVSQTTNTIHDPGLEPIAGWEKVATKDIIGTNDKFNYKLQIK